MKPNYKYLLAHALFWLLIILFSSSASIATDLPLPPAFFPDSKRYGMGLNILVFYINFLWLIPRLLSKRVRLYVLATLMLLIVSALLETLLDWSYLRYLDHHADQNSIVVLFFINVAVHVVFWLLSMLLRLAQDWFVNIRLRQQIKAEHAQTELALLKSQVHPHFLFNMLNTLYSSSYENGDEETAEGIGRLSNLLRYMLYETKDEQVPLCNEIDYLQDYIALQKMRFMDDVTVTFDIEGEPHNATVAPMMFINLVENAFKHGISPAIHSAISVKLTIDEAKIELTVENDILREQAKPPLTGQSGGMGLANLQRRLTLLYPQRHRLLKIEQNNRYITRLELT